MIKQVLKQLIIVIIMIRPTCTIFAVPPWAPEVAVPSAQSNRGFSLSLLPVLPQGRPVHSWWLTLLCGIDFRWHSDCCLGFTLTRSTLVSKLFYFAMQGSGAFLSSSLEDALDKCRDRERF